MRLFIHALFGNVFHPNLKSFLGAHPDGHQHGGRKVTETLRKVLPSKRNVITLELRNIRSNISFRAGKNC